MKSTALEHARQTLQIEAQAILDLIPGLNHQFDLAVTAILNSKGKLIVTGMGKSGIIGKKMAATLSSTGTPSFFMHPGEAFHGDLGMIEPSDIVLAISYSGETDEVLRLIPFFRKQGNVLIALSKSPESTLGKHAHYHISIAVAKEACPHDLAPTSSTTATLAIGDALAVALMHMRGFQPENFAVFHPGGSLGKRLLLRVSDVMISENLPVSKADDTLQELFFSISNSRLGLAVVCDDHRNILGLVTDGELRRTMQKVGADIFNYSAKQLMNPSPTCISADSMLNDAEEIMSRTRFRTLLVTDKEKHLAGVLDISSIQSLR